MPEDRIRKLIKRKIRIRRPGLTADADVQADIAVNISRSGSARSSVRQQHRRTDEPRPDVPPTESEGGES